MSMDNALPAERRLTGYHVLAIFVGFFLIVFAMNAVMIYQAVTTFGGLETTDAYRKGVAYNERIASEQTQAQLGWTPELSVSAARDGLVLRMAGPDQTPVTGLTVSGVLGRSATNKFDLPVTLVETEPGVYTTSNGKRLASGSWVANLTATRAIEPSGEQRFALRRRLWVTP